MILVQWDLITMLHGIFFEALFRLNRIEHERQILLSWAVYDEKDKRKVR